MPTSTSGNTVQLVINVVDANSGEVISTVTKNIDQLGASGTKAGGAVAAGMNAADEAGGRAGKKVGDGFKEMGRHGQTSLDTTRLLSQSLGIYLPRSMEAAIARNQALSAGLKAVSGLALALGQSNSASAWVRNSTTPTKHL